MAVTWQEVQCGTDWLRWLPLMNLPVVDLWGVGFWDYRLFLSCALWSPSSPSILVRLCEFEKGAVPMAAWNLQVFGRLKTKSLTTFIKIFFFWTVIEPTEADAQHNRNGFSCATILRKGWSVSVDKDNKLRLTNNWNSTGTQLMASDNKPQFAYLGYFINSHYVFQMNITFPSKYS